MQRREAGLLVFAAAIVAASLLTQPRRDVIAASADAPRAAQPARAVARTDLASFDADEWLRRLKARSMHTEPRGAGLFGGTNWNPPPPAPAATATQPERIPTPPFPFRVLGRMTLDGVTVLVLSKGEETYQAKAGEVIEQHRIEQIGDDELRVTYLPNVESRTYRYEELYPAVAATGQVPPSPMFAPQEPIQAPAAPIQRQRPQPQAQVSPPPGGSNEQGRQSPVGGAVAPSPPANPINPVPGAGEPIGGMVISPTPPGAGMVITPTPPGAGMIMTPTPPGALMQITPGNAAAGPTPSSPPQ